MDDEVWPTRRDIEELATPASASDRGADERRHRRIECLQYLKRADVDPVDAATDHVRSEERRQRFDFG
jgi:hypothetical protein